jgi:hypothetical protein
MGFFLHINYIIKYSTMKLIQLLLFINLTVIAQTTNFMAVLPNEIMESSGLINLDDRIITHNDSGGEAALFEIDRSSGMVLRKVVIENATNTDWEDICNDEDYIYIGDFGNNNGNRTDLKIYKISQEDYFNSDTVQAEELNFNYQDQLNFSNQVYATNYDAEALISKDDSLYLFSKNWGNFKSTVYALSKNENYQELTAVDTINTSGLITGAVFNETTNTVVLTGYLLNPFVVELKDFDSGLFSNGSVNKYNIVLNVSIQVEAICKDGDDKYLITTESSSSGDATLYGLSSNPISIKEQSMNATIFPNPCDELLTINAPNIAAFDVYSSIGKRVLNNCASPINVSNLPKGIYYLTGSNSKTKIPKSYKILVE